MSNGKYLWELFLELNNWKYYLKEYYHYTEIKNKKHKEDYIESIIDKLSFIKIMIEDIKKYMIINNVTKEEKITIARILGNIETGIVALNDEIKLLF